MTPQQEKYADKVAKLLRQAESTNYGPEAQAFIEKAQEIISTQMLTQELTERASKGIKKEREQIIKEVWAYEGKFGRAQFEIGYAIVNANNCRGLISLNDRRYVKNEDGTIKYKQNGYDAVREKVGTVRLTCIGFESDVENVKMLDSSLQVQCAAALQAWWKKEKDERDMSWMTQSQKYREQKAFIFGFAKGVADKLRQANEAAQAVAAKDEADRESVSVEQAQESVSLVLRDKKGHVKDWIDKHYGRSLRSSRSRQRYGSFGAESHGREAGRSANIGQKEFGSRRAVGAGV